MVFLNKVNTSQFLVSPITVSSPLPVLSFVVFIKKWTIKLGTATKKRL